MSILRSSLLALVGAVAAVYGQPAAAPPPAPKPLRIGGITITGSIRSRVYFWDWFEPAAGNNAYQYSGSLFRVALSQNRDSWGWNAEFAAPVLLGMPQDAVGTGPQQGALGLGANYVAANDQRRNAAMIFPKQLYVRLGGNKGHTLWIGRFEFLDGSEVTPKNGTLAVLKRDRIAQRLLGNFGFSDIGRSFDGFRYAYATPRDNVTVLAAVPTRGVFQVDGWGWNRAAFAYGAWTRQWDAPRYTGDTRLFFLEYDDFRHIVKTDTRPLAVRRGDLANIRIDTFGGHSLNAIETSAGTVDVVLWAAAQTGRWGVQSHRAGAVDVEAGMQPKALPKLKPWLRGGLTWASGDSDPSDNRHNTFFQVLPTPRPYARFPFFNMMNTTDRYGILILRPHSKLTTSTEFHALRLTDANDYWYSGGGVFQPWTFGYTGRATSGRRSLGNLYDTNVEARVNRRLTLTAYVGYTQGLAALHQIYPNAKDGWFSYLELLHRF